MFRRLNKSSTCILGSALAVTLLVVPLAGAHASTFELLYTFKGGSDGANPLAGLIADKAGNLYGTTEYGGGTNGNCVGTGCGVVFKLAPDNTESVIYAFQGGSDGASPLAGLVADRAGDLYGTTGAGGGADEGTVFKLAPDGTETVLHAFAGGSDGAFPEDSLLLRKGSLYGTTSLSGGDANAGTIFRLTRDNSEKVLYRFKGMPDGANPYAGVIADSAGNLYGTTPSGGIACYRNMDCGTVFELTPTGSETVLVAFASKNGRYPYGGLIMDGAGNLYGTTTGGSRRDRDGTVFKLAPDGTETILYSFCRKENCSDGEIPYAGVVADKNGNLYGTTNQGGATASYGTVFKLAPDGTETVLHAFFGGSDGAYPFDGLLLKNGWLYGTTYSRGSGGTVFRVKP